MKLLLVVWFGELNTSLVTYLWKCKMVAGTFQRTIYRQRLNFYTCIRCLRSQTMIQLEHLPFNDLIPWNIRNNASAYTCTINSAKDGEAEREVERERKQHTEIKTICTESTEQINGFGGSGEREWYPHLCWCALTLSLSLSLPLSFNIQSFFCSFSAPRMPLYVCAVGCVRDSNLSIRIQR